ncbi:hypothetical protein EV186_102466 [Labedaea rhizosphaerae]|uniref:Uncharacterized protein n=1 Tax=Labedaea rhizosphaerae TaxID=598644 RepID=A0A4R6SG08_LABRH|nr:hypothetical protein EV186_102466 [Labedaea rhizosphaerae]
MQAAEYYLRYLPGFQSRLDEMLGRSPMECRQGNHPSSWRRDVDAHNTAYGMSMPFSEKQVIDELRRQQFGFGSSTQG